MFESTERLEWKVEKRDEELITEFSSSTEVEEQVPNNYMTIRTETADVLPECVIRKILCFLSFKEAAKLSILSKTWLRAWLTHPNLDVIVDYNGNNLDIVDNIMKRYRDRIIPIEKFELSYFDSSSQGFPLIDKWFDIALQNGVKDIAFNVPKYSSYRLPIFKILATKSLRELVVWGCHLKRASLSTGVVNCNSLRLLSLSYVTLSEKMLQTLLNICPLIVSFVYFKPCLLHMSIFPENHIISANKLTNLWIAEGFVQNIEFGRLEEAAEGYLMDIISSNAVMASK
uniref:Uncharacterized protein n=1 Tax=Solanum lycopersicum TaxID=4081 RepID=A0A3Q7I6A7_SOLLC